jgi:hypothetical protein
MLSECFKLILKFVHAKQKHCTFVIQFNSFVFISIPEYENKSQGAVRWTKQAD